MSGKREQTSKNLTQAGAAESSHSAPNGEQVHHDEIGNRVTAGWFVAIPLSFTKKTIAESFLPNAIIPKHPICPFMARAKVLNLSLSHHLPWRPLNMGEWKASSSRKGRALCPHKKDPRNGSVRRKEGSDKKSPKRQKGKARLFPTSTTTMIRDPLLGRVPSRFLALQKGEPLHSIKVIYARASKWHGAHAHSMDVVEIRY